MILRIVILGAGIVFSGQSPRRYEQARKIIARMGGVDSASAPTQISVALSKGGILPALGMCEPMGKGAPVPAINPESKLGQTLLTIVQGVSDNTLDLWAEQATGKGE